MDLFLQLLSDSNFTNHPLWEPEKTMWCRFTWSKRRKVATLFSLRWAKTSGQPIRYLLFCSRGCYIFLQISVLVCNFLQRLNLLRHFPCFRGSVIFQFSILSIFVQGCRVDSTVNILFVNSFISCF